MLSTARLFWLAIILGSGIGTHAAWSAGQPTIPAASCISDKPGVNLAPADMVRTTIIGDPGGTIMDHPDFNAPAAYSLDHARAAVVLRCGDPVRGVNVGTLWIVSDPFGMKPRPPFEVASFVSRGANQPLGGVAWIDNNRLRFAAMAADGQATIQIIDIRSGHRKTVAHQNNIDAFSMNAAGTRAVVLSNDYTSVAPNPQCMGACRVTAASLFGALGIQAWERPDGLASYDIATGARRDAQRPEELNPRIEYCKPYLEPWPDGQLSPDGRYALRTCQLKPTAIPAFWKEYLGNNELRSALATGSTWSTVQDYFAGGELLAYNLSAGTAVPLFDAPYLPLSGRNIVWIEGGRRVAVIGAFEPFLRNDAQENVRRARKWSILAIDPDSRRYEVVAELDRGATRIVASQWNDADKCLSLSFSGDRIRSVAQRFCERSNGWATLPALVAEAHNAFASGGALSIEQSANDPPRLVLKSAGQAAQTILDPNAWLRKRAMGRVEPVQWKTKDGRFWRGQLIYPPQFHKGKRYPVLLQTHGFEVSAFSLSGVSNNYPGQALAAHDVLVLEIAENTSGAKSGPEYFTAATAGYEGAVEFLTRQGLIDPTKVGIIGWSRSGSYVAHTLTHSRLNFAAAAFTDTGVFGIWFYLMEPPALQREMEEDFGGVPFGPTARNWLVNTADANLDKVRTPTFMYEAGAPPIGLWDWYSGLRRFGVPVEYWTYANATHNLIDVTYRVQNTERLVDWFRFWLKGEEDSVPAKLDQYKRWRAMRSQWQPK
jgi:dipeptidyl aminopeptidase/acylaminoacyl peptidase